MVFTENRGRIILLWDPGMRTQWLQDSNAQGCVSPNASSSDTQVHKAPAISFRKCVCVYPFATWGVYGVRTALHSGPPFCPFSKLHVIICWWQIGLVWCSGSHWGWQPLTRAGLKKMSRMSLPADSSRKQAWLAAEVVPFAWIHCPLKRTFYIPFEKDRVKPGC